MEAKGWVSQIRQQRYKRCWLISAMGRTIWSQYYTWYIDISSCLHKKCLSRISFLDLKMLRNCDYDILVIKLLVEIFLVTYRNISSCLQKYFKLLAEIFQAACRNMLNRIFLNVYSSLFNILLSGAQSFIESTWIFITLHCITNLSYK